MSVTGGERDIDPHRGGAPRAGRTERGARSPRAPHRRPTRGPPRGGGRAEQRRDPAGAGPDEAALEGDVTNSWRAAAKRDEYLALAQRTQADFENYRKRMAREAAAAQELRVCQRSPASCCRRSTTSSGRWRPRPTQRRAAARGRCGSVQRELTRSARARVGIESSRRHRGTFDPNDTRGDRAAARRGRRERDASRRSTRPATVWADEHPAPGART